MRRLCRAAMLALGGCAPTPQTHGLDVAGGDTGDPPALRFSFPLAEVELFEQLIGMDHDPVVQEGGLNQLVCSDYLERSFPHCYDEHDGSDFLLVGSWDQMDNGSATIIAAAAGEVVSTVDGNYDRCHGSLETGTNDCDGYEMIANHVIIEHVGGYQALYWHMMKDSVAVEVGQQVERGEVLGKVGSSGNSFTPHLHFEVHDLFGQSVDPFAGPGSQETSFWCDQGDTDELPGDCEGLQGG